MEKQFIVETSARHVHVTAEDVKVLLGEEGELTVRAMLSQPGQFASNERVAIVGPKNTIKNVLILGPERPATQVEISATDARTLGIAAPVRESGDIAGTPGRRPSSCFWRCCLPCFSKVLPCNAFGYR